MTFDGFHSETAYISLKNLMQNTVRKIQNKLWTDLCEMLHNISDVIKPVFLDFFQSKKRLKLRNKYYVVSGKSDVR